MHEQCRDSAHDLSVKLDRIAADAGKWLHCVYVWSLTLSLVTTAYTLYTYCCLVTLTNPTAKATYMICEINSVLLAQVHPMMKHLASYCVYEE